MKKTAGSIAWIIISLLWAAVQTAIALERGEKINAVWIVIAAACVYIQWLLTFFQCLSKKGIVC